MATEDRPVPLPLRIAGGLLLAAGGAVVGGWIGHSFEAGGLPWDDALALLMGAMLIMLGGAMAVVMATRPSSVPKGCGVLQIVVSALAGVMLLLPLFALEWLSADVVMIAIVVLLVAQSAANWLLWKRADELLRRVMWETSALAFWALQLALFLYAAAERLGLISGVTAWGMIGILMTVYLLASVIVTARRGIK
jgi:hypothetical protein